MSNSVHWNESSITRAATGLLAGFLSSSALDFWWNQGSPIMRSHRIAMNASSSGWCSDTGCIHLVIRRIAIVCIWREYWGRWSFILELPAAFRSAYSILRFSAHASDINDMDVDKIDVDDYSMLQMILRQLNEAQARWFVAREAILLGHGGIKQMQDLTGMSRPTISRGIR